MPNEIPDKLIMGCTHSSAEVNVHPEGPPPPKKFMFIIEAPRAKSKAVNLERTKAGAGVKLAQQIDPSKKLTQIVPSPQAQKAKNCLQNNRIFGDASFPPNYIHCLMALDQVSKSYALRIGHPCMSFSNGHKYSSMGQVLQIFNKVSSAYAMCWQVCQLLPKVQSVSTMCSSPRGPMRLITIL